ncbi:MULTISPECIES: hypothetical protein [unclassified Staphylococcus]|uniref:hypothetical protein n=1 Tax=unclassified Staphylococcus TaxID=91994 RepID=UPI0018818B0F|nr:MULTISPECIES: hypothetical protein [unclassified Staphylococcus]MBF2758421.1 hypothetical protein [Staphylococcus haemolyticus]MBF2774808.1 hypothetical protein [Staphylococcus haemolyticus]MBF2777095.1 hypothetical protein [Staphylococcus haemolyticus]MBF2816689.1 hypothetical protein [Staphylococcus haemolyticus]MBF9721224.1 hypothetical protein [Staphylococcus haemolyticus]
MKKKITPKLTIKEEIICNSRQLLKYKLSLELFEKCKSTEVFFWLLRKNIITNKEYCHLTNFINNTPVYGNLYYVLLEKIIPNFNDNYVQDYNDYKKIIKELSLKDVYSNTHREKLLKNLLKYEVFIIDSFENMNESGINSIGIDKKTIKELMDNYGHELSKAFKSKINKMN